MAEWKKGQGPQWRNECALQLIMLHLFVYILPRGLPCFCAGGGADREVSIFLIPHLSWGGPNWEVRAHTPIIKLTYLSRLAIFVLGRSKL